SGPGYEQRAATFAAEIAAEIRRHVGADARLAVERVELALSDALRATGLALGDATPVLLDARRLKLDLEVMAMGGAIDAVDAAVGEFAAAITDGATEIGIWAELHRGLIAREGEYVSTRLMQSGPHTFPYFQEAGPRVVRAGDLVCLDTDAIGPHGYAVDFSRTFLCGDGPATSTQRGLHALAYEQLQHNAALLAPGRSFESFARRAWTVPARHAPFGYYCIAHGIGLSGEAPNIPSAVSGRPYPLPGEFELGMTVCVESYIGDPESAQGVKLEDQYLLTPTGAERLTTYPFDPALC
ncbi:MAG: M24 family metallopeptidase, partial [Actinomycetota bacterium]|nr:M24 family metallopeptidase [Actinomycetota bacterium]